MDFVFLPPEVNSARMYSGPGSGPLLAAAGSWDSLSAELGTAAQIWESVLWGLTSLQWRGPTAQAMMAGAGPYVHWLHETAEQNEGEAREQSGREPGVAWRGHGCPQGGAGAGLQTRLPRPT